MYREFIKYCVFLKILKYFGLWPFSVLPWCQCVYTRQAGRSPALQQNWQSSEKSLDFKEKTQYLMNTLQVNGGNGVGEENERMDWSETQTEK